MGRTIVMIASECAPVAKVGGLGDVVAGLSRELQGRGNAVEIILPKYDCMRYDQIWGLKSVYENLRVPWHNGEIPCTAWSGLVHGLNCYFIEPHSPDQFFHRGTFYGFDDEAKRFAFFSKAALEFLLKSGKRPDILHTHDWQTALVPVLLFEIYARHGMPHQRVLHTVHNFKHQGTAGAEILTATGLHRPGYFFSRDRMGDDGNPFVINFTKGAILYSNFVTTVSPHHAWEARHSELGNGLGHALHRFQEKFGGILNGLDYETWNPRNDPHIPHHFDAASIDRKYGNKKELRDRFWLRQEWKPVISYVGRLDTQKGIHLIRHALLFSIANGAQFVLLGTGSERGINDYFAHVKRELNDNPDCHLELGYNEELSHLIYAGSDMIVVPSLFEPCGLAQMIALRYGTVPVVRAVGGLADTVFDWHHSDRPEDLRNGFVFDHADIPGLESALRRAIGLWYSHPDQFRRLIENGLRADYSWNEPGRHYSNIYEFIRHK